MERGVILWTLFDRPCSLTQRPFCHRFQVLQKGGRCCEVLGSHSGLKHTRGHHLTFQLGTKSTNVVVIGQTGEYPLDIITVDSTAGISLSIRKTSCASLLLLDDCVQVGQ